MANTKSLNINQRKQKKREARKKNKELFTNLTKKNRKKFLVQIHDKKAKSKDGIVSFTEKINAEEEKKEEKKKQEAKIAKEAATQENKTEEPLASE